MNLLIIRLHMLIKHQSSAFLMIFIYMKDTGSFSGIKSSAMTCGSVFNGI